MFEPGRGDISGVQPTLEVEALRFVFEAYFPFVGCILPPILCYFFAAWVVSVLENDGTGPRCFSVYFW